MYIFETLDLSFLHFVHHFPFLYYVSEADTVSSWVSLVYFRFYFETMCLSLLFSFSCVFYHPLPHLYFFAMDRKLQLLFTFQITTFIHSLPVKTMFCFFFFPYVILNGLDIMKD